MKVNAICGPLIDSFGHCFGTQYLIFPTIDDSEIPEEYLNKYNIIYVDPIPKHVFHGDDQVEVLKNASFDKAMKRKVNK